MIQDSGNRREFETGAVRDIDEKKGRCDLLPLDIISFSDPAYDMLSLINAYIRKGNSKSLFKTLELFSKERGWNYPSMFLEVAIHYQEGCEKYGERNWEKGIPVHCYIDSAVRHYLKFKRGDTDERHDRAFVWNVLGALWTQKEHPELIDLPFNKIEE